MQVCHCRATLSSNTVAVATQFRYAFVCTHKGVITLDITDPCQPKAVGGTVEGSITSTSPAPTRMSPRHEGP